MAALLTSETRAEALLHPASASQRRTWFMELVAPGIPQHHLPFALEVFGELDVAALQLSLDLLVERHEALRTVFVDGGGELRQAISGPRAVVAHVDAPSGPDVDLQVILREQVAAPFNLSRGPLVRLVAVRRAPGVHVLVFVLHHIIADNLSLGLFVREMAEIYGALSSRNMPTLAALPWQYADFAVAEARWLASATFRARLQRYAEQLRQTTTRLDFDSEPTAATAQVGANHLVSLGPPVVDHLKQVAQRAGVTLFAVLLAALEKVLAPYADGPGFVIAVPVAGRGSDGADGVIGPFANIIALKTSLRASQTMAELLADVGRQLVDTLEYENVPWDALVRAINPSRSADAAPLSQVMFSSIAVPSPFERFGRLPCRPIWLPSPAPSADLFVSASETPDGVLWLGFDSRPDKVSHRTVSRLSGALRTVLLEIAHGDISTLEALPRGIGGTDLPLHDARGGTVSASGLSLASSETLQRHGDLDKLVLELWQEFLGARPSHLREDFFTAGGDSLLAVRLMSALCRRLDRKLPVALFFEDPSVAGLVAGLMKSDSGGVLDHAVTKIIEGNDGRLLFMCSAQHNSIKLAKALAPGPTVYKLDAYNLQEQRLLADQPMFDNVEAIAAEFRSRLKTIQPKGPYLLAGGCEGGVVAFEMAVQFQQEGEEVALLGQLDTPVRGFFESKPAFLGPIRTAKQWLDVCIRRMLTSNAPEYERHLRIWAGIWLAMRAYHPGRPFDGDVHLFRAARTLGMADVASGWDRRVSGRVVIHQVPGGHHTWMEYPRSAAIVRAALDAIVPSVSTVSRNQLID